MTTIISGEQESPLSDRGLKKNPHTSVNLKSPCRCGNQTGRFGAGRKPGESSLFCGDCGIFLAWLSKRQIKALMREGGVL